MTYPIDMPLNEPSLCPIDVITDDSMLGEDNGTEIELISEPSVFNLSIILLSGTGRLLKKIIRLLCPDKDVDIPNPEASTLTGIIVAIIQLTDNNLSNMSVTLVGLDEEMREEK